MKLVKRKKSRRFHGTRLWGRNSKKAKGSGNRGGKGMAGTGKRADHRKTHILKHYNNYFGKRGFKSKNLKLKSINIGSIQERINSFIKKGKAKKTNEGICVELKGYKILGGGEVTEKLIIKANSFSKEAENKIKKAGGKCESLKKEEDIPLKNEK